MKNPENVPLMISIKALCVTDNLNGTFTIQVPAKILTQKDRETLEKLFPHLENQVHRLLDQEALLANLATDSEIFAPKVNAKSNLSI